MYKFVLPAILLAGFLVGSLVDLEILRGYLSVPVFGLVVYFLGAVEGVGFLSRTKRPGALL